jgi:mannose-1-phosphate guanylyltransferase
VADNFDMAYAVILAGGYGTRFWPKSRQKKPKQLCTLGGSDKTLLEITLDRLEGIIPPERRIIITNKEQEAPTRSVVGERVKHIVAEPCSRNTAPAILLAALLIDKLAAAGEKPVMISLHADHAISDLDAFLGTLRTGISLARDKKLVLLGCIPTHPATGYGYIKRGAPLASPQAFHVAHFEEKPPRERAEKFVRSGDYYWNSGIFIWEVPTLLEEFSHYQPVLLEQLGSSVTITGQLGANLSTVYPSLTPVSIDEGIIENSKRVVVIESAFGWNDIGSWTALGDLYPSDEQGNVALGDILLLDCKNTLVESEGIFVAALGVENLVIVATKDALLICPQERSQEIKRIVGELEKRHRKELL